MRGVRGRPYAAGVPDIDTAHVLSLLDEWKEMPVQVTVEARSDEDDKPGGSVRLAGNLKAAEMRERVGGRGVAWFAVGEQQSEIANGFYLDASATTLAQEHLGVVMVVQHGLDIRIRRS